MFEVNGEPIFIRGGNWILSDGLLRLSKKRYNTDIKFHADMNFNMIRCWGGGLAERPEFYQCCDYYGLLVSCGLYRPSLFLLAYFFGVLCWAGWGFPFSDLPFENLYICLSFLNVILINGQFVLWDLLVMIFGISRACVQILSRSFIF